MRKSHLRFRIFPFFLFFGFFLALAWADPALPHAISDHAVFQQDREIHVWGTADPGEPIAVTLGKNTRATHADPGGHWSVLLPAMRAGGPFTLRVLGKKEVVIKDVMIGEVWVASGQSNMTFALSGSTGAAEEIPKADYPGIRLFTVPKRVAQSPQSDTLAASWQLCTPDTAKEFSAVAYYFARDLHRKLNVPIGIIESAWPGTAAEEWIAPEEIERDPQIKPMFDEWNRHENKGFAGARFDLEFDDFELLPDPASQGKPTPFADFDDGSARNSLGGYFSYDFRDAPATSFELETPGRSGQGYAAHVAGQLDASDDSRLSVRYQTDGSATDLSGYAGVRFWVRGDGRFRIRSLQPTITDWDDYSTHLLPASSDWRPVTIWFRDLRQEGWGVTEDFTPNSLIGFVIESVPASGYPSRPATGLFQGMIAPLLPYPFRGAIWYQGESNGWKPAQYRTLLPDLIESWRSASRQPDMQFLIVQLPNHGAVPAQPGESAWAELREAQLLTVKQMPGTGLAVTIDVGDPKDLHPHRKAEVGERLALWALGTTYHKSIVYSGPMYESMAVERGTIRIRFAHTGGGLKANDDGALRGFAIAGEDRVFHWAEAQIDRDSVVVSSPQVAAPVAVRYAWGDSPECNLFNAEGLPASPFRTDLWQDPVGNAK
ncbi:MAG TPA: sialate O-acetylesterase [Candidatus Sulfotelmatobacter sp.]|jgi:sialate O-acetylesterase